MSNGSLAGKTACITGAAGDLGGRIGRLFEKAGANLILLDINPDILKREDEKKRTLAYHVDLNKAAEVRDVIGEAVSRLETPIDYLVNSAGIMKYGDTLEMDVEDWKETIEVNLNSVFYAAQAVLPYMIRQRFGRILNIASVFGIVSTYRMTAYSASKAAVISLTKSLALDFAEHNIHTNCIAPGIIKNRFSVQFLQKILNENKKLMDNFVNMPRVLVDAAEIATLAYTVMVDIQSINGEIITIDNGYIAR